MQLTFWIRNRMGVEELKYILKEQNTISVKLKCIYQFKNI